MNLLEMVLSDPKTAESFYKIIETVVDKKLKKLEFDKSLPGVVSYVDGNYVSVKIMGSDVETPDIENLTGKTLTIGDSVEVLAIRGSMNNLVVKIKKGV